jgi:hypothetical protein
MSGLDAIALVLFILYSVRRLELAPRTAAEHPGVAPEAFDQWKRGRARLYLLGAAACSLKPVLGTLLPYVAFKLGVSYALVRVTGGVVDLTFIVVLLVVVYLGYRSTKHALELGVSASPARAPDR